MTRFTKDDRSDIAKALIKYRFKKEHIDLAKEQQDIAYQTFAHMIRHEQGRIDSVPEGWLPQVTSLDITVLYNHVDNVDAIASLDGDGDFEEEHFNSKQITWELVMYQKADVPNYVNAFGISFNDRRRGWEWCSLDSYLEDCSEFRALDNNLVKWYVPASLARTHTMKIRLKMYDSEDRVVLDRIQRFLSKVDTYREKRASAHKKIEGFLANYSSPSRAIKDWPELAPFVDAVMVNRYKAPSTALVSVELMNKEFELPATPPVEE